MAEDLRTNTATFYTKEMQGFDHIFPNPSDEEVVYLWKIGRQGNGPGAFSFPSDVCFLPSGYISVADYTNKNVQIFDGVGEWRQTIQPQNLQPFGVCSAIGGHVGVTDQCDKCVKIFTTSGQHLDSFGHGQFKEPSGLAQMDNGNWVVSDTQDHTVKIFSPNGQIVRQIGGKGEQNEQFQWPGYITTDSKNRIIVSDGNNFAVKVFDPEGNFLFKFGGQKGESFFPRGLAVDSQDVIAVVNWAADRISVYSSEGKFQEYVLTLSQTRICNPHGIACDRVGHIALTTRKPTPTLCLVTYYPYD